MKNNVFKASFALIITLTMLVSGCATITGFSTTKSTADSISADSAENIQASAHVTIDVNPSIELTLTGGLVTEATAFNDDGAAVILSANLLGSAPEAAIATIIAQLSADGYLNTSNKASLVITVTGESAAGLTESLKKAAKQNIETLGVDCRVVAASVPSDIAQAAKGYGLSTGRYMMLSYIAEQEGITIEEAIAEYGSLPMEKVFEFIKDTEKFLSKIDDWNEFIAGLPAGQQQIISAALQAYREAMRAAEQAFKQAREDAKNYYKAAKDAAEAAYKSDHDKNIWKQAEKALNKAFEEAKKNAQQAFKDAKAAAKTQFIAAVAGLGLSDKVIEKLLHWDFDLESFALLPAEQQSTISAALQAYGAAMREAERTYKYAKENAKTYYEAAKDAAEAAYKIDKDKEKYEQTKKALKKQYEEAKKNAPIAFKAAKESAKAQFIAAVSGLGLSDKAIKEMLHWDSDINFSYDDKD